MIKAGQTQTTHTYVITYLIPVKMILMLRFLRYLSKVGLLVTTLAFGAWQWEYTQRTILGIILKLFIVRLQLWICMRDLCGVI